MEYFFGRLVLNFLGLLCLVIIVAGGVIAIAGATVGYSILGGNLIGVQGGYFAAIPGIAVAIIGVFLIAIVEVFAAILDTASATRKSARIAEEQLKVSKEALRQGQATQASFAAVAGISLPVEPELETEPSKGGLFGFRKRRPSREQGEAEHSGGPRQDPPISGASDTLDNADHQSLPAHQTLSERHSLIGTARDSGDNPGENQRDAIFVAHRPLRN